MSDVLMALGIQSQTQKDYNTQFGITLNKRTLQEIVPSAGKNLMADIASEVLSPANIANLDPVQLQEIMTAFDIQSGETDMLLMDASNIPSMPAQSPMVMVAESAVKPKSDNLYGTMGVCYPSSSTNAEFTLISVSGVAEEAFKYKNFPLYVQDLGKFSDFVEKTAETKILQQPKFGILKDVPGGELNPKNHDYEYKPNAGYIGNDKAVFLVTFGEYKVKVVYFIKVIDSKVLHNIEQVYSKYCPQPSEWLISSDNLISPAPTALSDVLNSASQSFTGFADLPAGALGQTTGTSITLDDNAANNNWFIDATPGSNEEFLPTSNPYEWVAKEGSAAYGKMDMLSVLLHEYGHALGIEHSADGHDYMATTLTAGVRRLPSAEELALMQNLIAQQAELLQNTPATPDKAPSQLPLLPLGGFGLAFLGRLRSSRYGSLNVEADLSTLVTQYAVTANEKLTNGNFSVASGMPIDNGWATQGSVDFANGSATLKEVSTSQTRLNQVFVVNPRDRFLSFTIAGSVLDDVNGAPDDAFEIALLDANTGLSLAGAFSLTHTDAMLNLQADGTETAASSVTRVTNPDGSRTYRVDLYGIAVGTAVNLSFDLIGFGKDSSEVIIRDVRVSGLPELHDDAATMNEDGSLAFDPFAQVDNAALLQLGSHVVDQPAHGTVTVNADGTFVYTPAADYFGTDSFSYRLNDGPLESNLATVSVSIAAVNDAPVAADVYATLAEDTPLQITLGNFASDVDNPSPQPSSPARSTPMGAPLLGSDPTPAAGGEGVALLSIQIVDAPSHGVLVANADGSYTYTAEANYFGVDSFTYQANDGELNSNIATVNLNITPINDAPVANDVAVYTLEDTQLTLNLLANVVDVDSTVLNTILIAGPQHGQLLYNADGSFNYVSDPDYFGSDSFTYKVNDGDLANGGLESNIVTVSLNIAAVNDAPLAVSAAVTGLEDTPYIFNWNDFKVSDVDNDNLLIIIN